MSMIIHDKERIDAIDNAIEAFENLLKKDSSHMLAIWNLKKAIELGDEFGGKDLAELEEQKEDSEKRLKKLYEMKKEYHEEAELLKGYRKKGYKKLINFYTKQIEKLNN